MCSPEESLLQPEVVESETIVGVNAGEDGGVSDVAEAGAEAMRGRVVQYKSTESPGVGYALYALIPILDHASTMSRVSDQYEPLKGATLRAIKRLLEHRPARDKRDP